MKKNVKIYIPSSKPDELTDVADTMSAKDEAMGDASPLKILDKVPFKKNLAEAKSKRAEAKRLHEKAEELNQQANLCLGLDPTQSTSTPGTVYNYIISGKNILEGYYKGQEKMLQEWGLGVVITEGPKSGKRKQPPSEYEPLLLNPAAEGFFNSSKRHQTVYNTIQPDLRGLLIPYASDKK